MDNISQEQLDELNDAPFIVADEEVTEESEVNASEPAVEEKVSDLAEEKSVADEARVPYSRFNTVNERAIIAETKAQMLQEQLERLNQGQVVDQETVTPEEWTELYGDNEAAKRAWALQEKLTEKAQDKLLERTLERIQSQQQEAEKELKQNLSNIENSLAEFQESLGRKLTEVEESAILDIQDEFTPKGNDGKYVAPLLSPEKAFEVYTLRQQGAGFNKSNARKRVLSVTGADSSDSGEGSESDYDPSAWGSWKKKL